MLIGITGRKHHGKDTVAQMFVERGYTQIRFADPLKNMLRAFYATVGVQVADIEERIEGALKEIPCGWLCGETPRRAMQTLGAEWGRVHIGDRFWVDTLLRRAGRGADVVVSDVRYPNECAAIKSSGGLVFRVDAGKRVPQNEFSNHSSETEIDNLPVDRVIDNNGSAAQLREAIDQLCRDLSWVESPPMSQETKVSSGIEERSADCCSTR